MAIDDPSAMAIDDPSATEIDDPSATETNIKITDLDTPRPPLGGGMEAYIEQT